MVLREVRKSLKGRGEATFTQIAADTGLSPAMLRSALDYWIKRGDVEELPPGSRSPNGEAASTGSSPADREVKCASCPLAAACSIPQPKRPRSCHVPEEGTLFLWRGNDHKKTRPEGRVFSEEQLRLGR